MNYFSSLRTTIYHRIVHLGRSARILFVVLVGITLLGALGSLVSLSNYFTHEVPLRGGTYRHGLIGTPRFINPVLANTETDRELTTLVYSGLVRKKSDLDTSTPDDFIPDLASSWSSTPDGKEYTFLLNPEAVFHDGTPVTSHDVMVTLQKIQDPLMASPYRILWTGVSLSAPDEHTVVFKLEKPYAGFLQQMTTGILPAHLWENLSYEAWQTTSLNLMGVGSGPYEVTEIVRDASGLPQKITTDRFKKTLGTYPYLDHLVFLVYTNTEDALGALKRDDLDGLNGIDPKDSSLFADTRFHVLHQAEPKVFSIFLNASQNPLFADKNIVRALNLAVDKDALIQTIFKGYGNPLYGPLPFDRDTLTPETHTERIALAQKMLDAAGWKLNPETGIREKTTVTTSGTGKKATSSSHRTPLTFTLVTAHTPDLETSARMIAEQYQQLGIGVQVEIFELGNFYEHVIGKRDFEALLFGQVLKHDTDIFAFWHSSQKSSPGLNITGYTNKQVDQLLEQAVSNSSSQQRAALYEKITQQLQKDAPVVFLYTPERLSVIRSSFHHSDIPQDAYGYDTFAHIASWYTYTDRIWNIFTH